MRKAPLQEIKITLNEEMKDILSAEEMLVIEKLIENDELQKLNDNIPSFWADGVV